MLIDEISLGDVMILSDFGGILGHPGAFTPPLLIISCAYSATCLYAYWLSASSRSHASFYFYQHRYRHRRDLMLPPQISKMIRRPACARRLRHFRTYFMPGFVDASLIIGVLLGDSCAPPTHTVIAVMLGMLASTSLFA